MSRPQRLAYDTHSLTGRNDRIRADETRALAARLIVSEARERHRIAEGLHDEVGQSLALIKMKLSEMRNREPRESAVRDLGNIVELVDGVIRHTRSLTFELSSPILHRLGLTAAIQSQLDEIARGGRLEVALDAEQRLEPIAADIGILLFRSVCELLRNVEKHARARAVRVSLRRADDLVQIAIEDDGVGFEVGEVGTHLHPGGGFGLFSISQGLHHVGGSCQIDSRVGRGSRVEISVRLPRGREIES